MMGDIMKRINKYLGILLFPCLLGTASATSYAGMWMNSENSPGVSRIELNQGQAGIELHTYARCAQAECDWGKSVASTSPDGWTAQYHFDFKTVRLDIRPQAEALQVIVETDYTDGRPSVREDHTFILQ